MQNVGFLILWLISFYVMVKKESPRNMQCTGISKGVKVEKFHLRNEFHFSGVHGAMNRSGSRAK